MNSSIMVKRVQYTMPDRISRELTTVRYMTQMYCADNHDQEILCESCTELMKYAELRLENCRYQENKPVCSHCPTQCYRKSKAEEMRHVMRHSGPKMIKRHPVLAMRHLLDEKFRS